MSLDGVYIALRVGAACILFAFFVFVPLRSRHRYGSLLTGIWAGALVAITIAVTILFLTPNQFLSDYNLPAIIIWIGLALVIFRITIKATFYELLFIVLVVLNLYVNIMAITKSIVSTALFDMPGAKAQFLVAVCVLILYTPLLYILMMRFYKQVIELDIYLSFWKVIWVIPALTYMVFYVKIVNDYWKEPVHIEGKDVIFSILWSFTTYAFFLIILMMLIQEYKGIIAAQKAGLAVSQLQMQEEQYERLIGNIEDTARLRHDWRHHLLIINGFSEDGDGDGLKEYLQELMPEYLAESETPVCDNHVVDIILRHYFALSKENGILMRIHAEISADIPIAETDMGIVFGNLTENAVQACKSLDSGERIVDIRAITKGNQLVIIIKNTFDNQIVQRSGKYLSTKHEGQGRGISSVRRVVDKYHGLLKITHDESFFTVSLFMNPVYKGD